VFLGHFQDLFHSSLSRTRRAVLTHKLTTDFERLLWYIAFDVYGSEVNDGDLQEKRRVAGSRVSEWQRVFKAKGGFSVEKKVLEAARKDFASERVSDTETLATIQNVYRRPDNGSKGYILDPHSAIGVTAALRSAKAAPGVCNVALLTAHPAKFSRAVEMALLNEPGVQFKDILPPQFVGLEDLPRRYTCVLKSGGLDGIGRILVDEVKREVDGKD